MTSTRELSERNAAFAAGGFVDGLRINPGGNVMVVGCVDPAPVPDLLAEYFEIPADGLDAKAVGDPVTSVRVDVDVILAALTGSAFLVSGLVYDVSTGLVETVVPPTPPPWGHEPPRDAEPSRPTHRPARVDGLAPAEYERATN